MENENENRISSKVFEKIKSENVQMKSSCFFLFKSWLWLGISGVLFLVAALFVSLDVYYLDAMESVELFVVKPMVLLSAIPYFLFAITVVVIVAAAIAYRKSRSCCRHENWMLLIVLVFGALLIGISAHFANLQNKARIIMENKAFFNSIVTTPQEFWFQPEKGTMSGLIVSVDSPNSVLMKSWDGSKWEVSSVEGESLILVNNKGNRRRVIKMIGQKKGEYQFQAQTVWGW